MKKLFLYLGLMAFGAIVVACTTEEPTHDINEQVDDSSSSGEDAESLVDDPVTATEGNLTPTPLFKTGDRLQVLSSTACCVSIERGQAANNPILLATTHALLPEPEILSDRYMFDFKWREYAAFDDDLLFPDYKQKPDTESDMLNPDLVFDSQEFDYQWAHVFMDTKQLTISVEANTTGAPRSFYLVFHANLHIECNNYIEFVQNP